MGLTKVRRGGTDTGISDSSDATAITIDSSENVGIGESSPSSDLVVKQSGSTFSTASQTVALFQRNSATGSGCKVTILSGNNTSGDLNFGDAEDEDIGKLAYEHNNNAMTFTTNTSERMRIDSNGTLLVNDTGRALTCKAQITYNGGSEQGLIFENEDNSASGAAIRFVDVDGDFSGGGIYYHDSNSINYQTTSDYRLKENIVTDWDATTELKKLKPSKFNFKKTPEKTVQGFIAHEVSDIVPEAIIGVKDGTETYIDDDDGKEKTREAYQSIDQSKLVPLLTKALQEAIAKIEILEAKVTALESK